jgi:hypothetical protein
MIAEGGTEVGHHEAMHRLLDEHLGSLLRLSPRSYPYKYRHKGILPSSRQRRSLPRCLRKLVGQCPSYTLGTRVEELSNGP